MNLCYFDHNATTPLVSEASVAWLEATEQSWLNPSSPYRNAAAVRVRYEAARESLAAQLGIAPERLVFTSGATEANNDVFRYWARQLSADTLVGVNPTEHPSVIEAAEVFLGRRVEWLQIKSDGRVDVELLGERVRSGQMAAVSVMAANNETGVLQPWQEIADICSEANVPYHCDASQWVGKMPLNGLSQCSYVTACAHKFGGPKGVGFITLPNEAGDFSILLGGAQEQSHRAGTEDVAGVLAMLAALEVSKTQESSARDDFIKRIVVEIPGSIIVGHEAPRLWNTVSLILPRHRSMRWICALEKLGFLVSVGSACATGKASVSATLLAMRIDPVSAGRALRISSGVNTRAEDWQALLRAMVVANSLLDSEASAEKSTVISLD